MDPMGFFRSAMMRVAMTIGFLPKPASTTREFAQSFADQSRKLQSVLVGIFAWAVTYAFFLVLGNEPTRLDQTYVLIAVILLIVIFDLCRLQLHVISLWAAQALSLLPVLAQQHQIIQKLSDMKALEELGKELTDAGWMYSVGIMNTANRTGPTAFVWKPDVVVKDGKVEARAYMGIGDTLAAALYDAMSKR